MSWLSPSLSTVVVCAGVVLAPRAARADDVAAAARAYSQAQAAELDARHARAAGLYELADRIAPTPEALRGAARTRFAAGDGARAATHAAELLRRYPEDAAARRVAEKVLSRLSDQLGRVEVTCDDACTVSIDGVAVAVEPRREHVFYADPGEHRVSATFAGAGAARERVALRAGGRARVALEAPAAEPEAPPRDGGAEPVARTAIEDPFPPPPSHARGGGPSKAWFFTGAAITLGLAGAATWSGLDVLDAHERYEQDPTEDGYQDGLRRERRTNLLIGGASVAAAGTILMAVFTDWSGGGDERASERRRVGLAPAAGGALVILGGGF